MPISLKKGEKVSLTKNNPGLAFGITTAGLFLGLLPAFFMQFDRTVNAVLITVLSLLCFFLLRVSLPDSVKNRG